MRFGGLWDRRSFQRYREAPGFNLEDPEVHLVDLDGDGVTDAIRSGSRMECFFNDPIEGWHTTRWVERQALEVFPNVTFSDPRVKWADMTGDGLQDIVLVYDGIVEYWPNRGQGMGQGSWGKRISMHNGPRFPSGYNPRRLLIGDVDGDGLADLIYVDDTHVTLWINQSGNGWSDPIIITGTPPVTDMDAVRLVDLFGNGVAGVLWSADAGLARTHMFFLDFTGGSKPYLLNEMDNHTGSLTRVSYAPSTRFYLEDQKRRETRWQTPLPFPVQVVARVEVLDALSGGKLTTRYAYHHGYWDGVEREFRGFGRVEQRDTEVFADDSSSGWQPDRPFEGRELETFSPPLETRTWFHQGPIEDESGEWLESDFSGEFWVDDAQVFTRALSVTNVLQNLARSVKRDALRTLRGHVVRTELYALDGTQRQTRPYTVTEFLYGVREEAPPGPNDTRRLSIFFPYAQAQRTTQWERGTDPMTRFTFTDGYDPYGQPTLQTSIAVPRRRDFRVVAAPGAPYLATHAVTTYAQRDEPGCYIVNRVACTTSYEILNDGSPGVFDLQSAILDSSTARQISGQTLNFYDGLPFQGLPCGQIGDYGALVRTENLVLTQDIVREAYKSGSVVQTPAQEPPYLTVSGPPAWTTDYPQEFRDLLPPLAGYTYQPGGTGSVYIAGYFVEADRRHYDFHDDSGGKGRGLIKMKRDPLEHDTAISYDVYDFRPTQVTDPVGLTARVVYDYRVLQPREVTDPNGNQTTFTYTPLGLLESTAVMGKAGAHEGDTPAVPGTRMIYDFHAFDSRRQPISVHTIQRVYHVSETAVPLPERDETIEKIEFSDGCGRLLQTRSRAEDILFGDPIFGDAGLPADQSRPVGGSIGQRRAAGDPPNVVVSGWQIYDNKGKVVEKYEPFFSTAWDYAPPTAAQHGQKVMMYYDPRGHTIRTINPDASEQRVIYGVPGSIATPELTTPDIFEPTPWEVYTYDANDNAGRTHPTTAPTYQNHWNTPASALIDALGRTTETSERNGPNPLSDWYTTRSTYDVRGNVLSVTDALKRVAFRHIYDLANRPLRSESIDAGKRRIILDASGNSIEQRDSKGALTLHAHDTRNRLVRLWARDDDISQVTLRERLEYGDGGNPGQPGAERAAHRAANRLGNLYQHYDEAGRLTCELYDFKQNVREKVRQVIGDPALLAVFTLPPATWQGRALRVDWQPPGETTQEHYVGSLLDAHEYRTSLTYDALNRVKVMRYPQDVDGARKGLYPHYNSAGALESVHLDSTTYVQHIAYNAHGQRTLIAYGNGMMTRHAYEPQTFRLARMRSEPYRQSSPLAYTPSGAAPLQDYAYVHDLAGNILTIHDRTPAGGIPNTAPGLNALERIFTYDPLYRLLSATGRECDVPPALPWLDEPRCTDPTRTRAYQERYRYDPLGNLLQLHHQVNSGNANRGFELAAGSNRLATVTLGLLVYHYVYDVNGNLTQEATARHFEWDHSDRMRAYRTQPGNAEPSVHAQYLYDATGQRVKKLVRKQGGQIAVTIAIEGVFEHHRHSQGSARQENNTLHVMDNQSRIALIRVGNPCPDDVTPAVTYHLGDHLGSNNVVVDEIGGWIKREESTPYGEVSFGSFAWKRYRFTGKERDSARGLDYFGARYYAAWLGRWMSCDPAGMVDGPNLYNYGRDNPLNVIDARGLDISSPPASINGTETPQLGGTITGHRQQVSPSGSPPAPSGQPITPPGTAGVVMGGEIGGHIRTPGTPTIPVETPGPLNDVGIQDPTFAYKYKAPAAGTPAAIEAPAVGSTVGSRILSGLLKVVKIGGILLTFGSTLKSDGPTFEDMQKKEEQAERRQMLLGPHDHHIFPREFREEFQKIGIDVEKYAITIPSNQHMGENGLHKNLDYNNQWYVFFYGKEKPTQAEAAGLVSWLLHQAGLDDPKVYPIHYYRDPGRTPPGCKK
jgi:RHS repeat-associated protein